MVPSRPKRKRQNRHGFTLIELMIVIVIIAILVGLLVPAVNAARNRARIAQVRTEISTLESAVANFRQEYGIEPPGNIRIYATSAGWTNTGSNASEEAIRVRSRAYIRQIWPQFDFSQAGGVAFPAAATTVDGNGAACLDLNGAECLVFFLGGIGSTTSNTLTGFSKDPALPLSATGANRTKPYFEFVAARFVDKDGDTAPEYVDTLPGQTSPYLYFDSNDGRGYTTGVSGGSTYNADCFADAFYNNATTSSSFTWANGDWMPKCYYTDSGLTTPFMANKYQIISPGMGGVRAGSPDVAYGVGGYFDSKNATTLVLTPDGDNITNFQSGTLSGQ